MEAAEEVDELCQAIGACNTLIRTPSGSFRGTVHNGIVFEALLQDTIRTVWQRLKSSKQDWERRLKTRQWWSLEREAFRRP